MDMLYGEKLRNKKTIFQRITPQQLVRLCIYHLTKDRPYPPKKDHKEIYLDMEDVALIFAKLKEKYHDILQWYIYSSSDPERPHSRALSNVWSSLEMALLYRPLDCCQLKYSKLGFDDADLFTKITRCIREGLTDRQGWSCMYELLQFLDEFVELANTAEQENIDAYNEYMKPHKPIKVQL